MSLHHRHLHDVTGTSSCFLKNPALFGVYLYLYSGKQVYFTSVYRDKQIRKKGKRKVQGVPQSQNAAHPRPQEEEETDKSKQAQTEQTYEKH